MKDHTIEVDLRKKIQHLEEENRLLRANRSLDSMDEVAYRELQRKNRRLKEIEESHQELNGKLRSRIIELEQDNLELHADNKKISRQIEDQVERARKAGM